MAADTAYLEGGPCDGTTRKLTPAESDSGELTCKNGVYRNTFTGQKHDGDIVFKYVGTTPIPAPTGGGSSGGKAAYGDAFKGWDDLRRSFNRHLPESLDRADTARRAALRSLSRASRVKT